jgi:hypothetical protein
MNDETLLFILDHWREYWAVITTLLFFSMIAVQLTPEE